MTKRQEIDILESKSTHRIVHDVISLAQDNDRVDAYCGILLAAEILKGRMDRVLGNQ